MASEHAGYITVLNISRNARPNQSVSDAVLFRMTDIAGIAVTSVQPEVTVVSGGGVVNSVSNWLTTSPPTIA